MSSNLIDSHFCNVINYNIEDKTFPDSAKIASPRPIYKNKSRHKIQNYRPISIFNMTKGHTQVVGHKYSMGFYIKIKRSWLVITTVKNFREFPCVVFEKSRSNILLNFHILYAFFHVMKYLKLGTWFLQKFPQIFTVLLNQKILFNAFYKICERYIHNSLNPFVNICQFLYLLREKLIVQTMFLLDLLKIGNNH